MPLYLPARASTYSRSVARCLSSTSSHYRAPARSPRVVQKERVIRRGPRPATALPRASALSQWPVELIQHALKDSKAAISKEEAVSVLDGFVALKELGKGILGKHVETFVRDYRITPKILSGMARILLRAGDQRFWRLSEDLFVAASSLEDETATLTLMEEALKYGKPEHIEKQSIQGARAHLVRLAQARNPSAMMVLAKDKEVSGKFKEALALYRGTAKECEERRDSKEGQTSSIPGEAWESIGRLTGRMNMFAEEEEAIKTAALIHDNPKAYYTLALKFRKPSDNQYLEYMLKAAASGIGDAAYRIGLWYLAQAEGQSSSKYENIDLIQEWFYVVAESPRCQSTPLAKLHVARLLYLKGDTVGAMRLLDEAEKVRSTASNAIDWLRSCWTRPGGINDSMTGSQFEAFINGEPRRAG